MIPHSNPTPTPEEAYCPACGASYSPDASICPREGTRLVKLKVQVDPMIGRVLDGRYEVRAVLGAGGMGTVYRGHQLSVDREVAIKVIHATFAADRTAVKRFLREARLSSRIVQPSIVSVFDFGQTEDGVLFLVMELVRGHALERELGRPMALARVAGIGLQLCAALEAAHQQDIVHRDLKPANIIVLDDPAVRDLIKVLDFGLARSLTAEDLTRVTMSNAILGTPMYMAPEQIRGRVTDQRADLYSLGCILFHMLAGRAPFGGDSVNGLLAAHLNDPVPALPATVPVRLARAIQSLLVKDPEQRAASVDEVRAALASPIDEPIVRKSRGKLAAVLGVVVAVGVAAGAVALRRSDYMAPRVRPAIATAPAPSPPAPTAVVTPSVAPSVAPATPPKPTARTRKTKSPKAASAPALDFYPSN